MRPVVFGFEVCDALAHTFADGRGVLSDHLAYDSLDLFADSADVSHALNFSNTWGYLQYRQHAAGVNNG